MSDFHKLFVIGLDGGTWDALDIFIKKGYMPFLAQLKEQSSHGILNSTIPPFTMPAWTTFYTGQNPGNHGIISFWRYEPNDYNLDNVGEFVNSTALDPANLWNQLSLKGRKLVVVNVPLTYPPQPIDGVMISGMLTPPDADNMTYPPELKNQLEDYHIDLNIRAKDRFELDHSMNRITMLSKLIDLVNSRKKNTLKLLANYPHDFFMIVFTSTDRLFHFFWDLIVEDHDLLSQKYSNTEISELQEKLKIYCHTLDDAIKELVQVAGENANIFMMSDHGFGNCPSRLFNVNRWLKKQSYLFEKTSGKNAINPLSWIIRLGKSNLVRRITPASLEKKLKSAVKGKFKDLIDWNKTTAYYEPMYMNIGGITINVIGQKREGSVPEADKETLLQQVTENLLQIEDPKLNQKVIEKVVRREELFQGERSEIFPDLIFFARSDYQCSNSLVEKDVVRDHIRSNRPGDHRTEGIFLACGPDIRKGVKNEIQDIVNLAPTFLYLLDVPIIDKFDGQIMEGLLSKELLEQRKPTIESFKMEELSQDFSFKGDEDEALRERLKNLGYM